MGNRILDIEQVHEARGKAYPVKLKDGSWVWIPVRGVVDGLPGALVVKDWCYRYVMKEKRKQEGPGA